MSLTICEEEGPFIYEFFLPAESILPGMTQWSRVLPSFCICPA